MTPQSYHTPTQPSILDLDPDDLVPVSVGLAQAQVGLNEPHVQAAQDHVALAAAEMRQLVETVDVGLRVPPQRWVNGTMYFTTVWRDGNWQLDKSWVPDVPGEEPRSPWEESEG